MLTKEWCQPKSTNTFHLNRCSTLKYATSLIPYLEALHDLIHHISRLPCANLAPLSPPLLDNITNIWVQLPHVFAVLPCVRWRQVWAPRACYTPAVFFHQRQIHLGQHLYNKYNNYQLVGVAGVTMFNAVYLKVAFLHCSILVFFLERVVDQSSSIGCF